MSYMVVPENVRCVTVHLCNQIQKRELMAEWNNLLAGSMNEDEDRKYFSAKAVDGMGPIYGTILRTIKVLLTLKPSHGQLL